jgi:hypothetical protein
MRTKKVKPPPKKFEYLLKISKSHDRYEKKDFISFRFYTTKEFLTFKYILNIETEVSDNSIVFNIAGFKAPVGDLSNFGHAEFEYRFFDFKQTEYSVIIHRKDVDKSKFKLSISRSKSEPFKISGVSKNSFIDVSTTK